MMTRVNDTAALYVPQFNDDYWMKEIDERCKERLNQPNCICPPAESRDHRDVCDGENDNIILWIDLRTTKSKERRTHHLHRNHSERCHFTCCQTSTSM